jgi:hypothetical protein
MRLAVGQSRLEGRTRDPRVVLAEIVDRFPASDAHRDSAHRYAGAGQHRLACHELGIRFDEALMGFALCG